MHTRKPAKTLTSADDADIDHGVSRVTSDADLGTAFEVDTAFEIDAEFENDPAVRALKAFRVSSANSSANGGSSSSSVWGVDMPEFLHKALASNGITAPTGVQRAAMEPVLSGDDVLIQSGTGTGKTLAYLLPLLQRVRADASCRVLIVAPSPELAMQILRQVEIYKGPGISSASLVGSGNIGRQKERLKKHPQVMVGTPGRVLEMIFARKLQTKHIKALVLDETDLILSEKNDEELREICSRPEFKAQVVLASATFGKYAEAFARDHMSPDRHRVQVDMTPLHANIDHRYLKLRGERDPEDLLRVIAECGIEAGLVFVHKSYNVAKLFHALQAEGISCDTVSAERSKQQREQAIEAFRKGKVRMLVATDAAARGLDIKDLRWVIHYEMPNDKNSYVHRAGRTGRAGQTGTSLLLVTPGDMETLQRYVRELKIDISPLF